MQKFKEIVMIVNPSSGMFQTQEVRHAQKAAELASKADNRFVYVAMSMEVTDKVYSVTDIYRSGKRVSYSAVYDSLHIVTDLKIAANYIQSIY